MCADDGSAAGADGPLSMRLRARIPRIGKYRSTESQRLREIFDQRLGVVIAAIGLDTYIEPRSISPPQVFGFHLGVQKYRMMPNTL